jgi:transposase
MDKEILAFYVENGFSTYSIAKKINKSQTTVNYWLKKYNLKTKNNSFKNGYHKSNKVDIQNQVCFICGNTLTIKNAYLRKDRNVYFLKCKNVFQ